MQKHVVVMGLFVLILVGGLVFLTIFDREHVSSTKTDISVSQGTIEVSGLDGKGARSVSAGQSLTAESGQMGDITTSPPPSVQSATQETSLLPGTVNNATSTNQQTADSEIQLVTKDIYWVSGYVKSDKGEPLSDVSVVAKRHVDDDWIDISTQSNKEGYYAIELKQSGGYRIVATPSDDYLIASAWFQLDENNKSVTKNFTLGAAGLVVQGQVTDKSTSEPIAGAKIALQQRDYSANTRQETVNAVSDGNGEFTLRHIAPGLFSISAVADNYVCFNPANDFDNPQPLARLRIDERTQSNKILIKMEPGNAATIRVLTPDKKPLEDASVHLHISSINNLQNADGNTDAKGEFSTTQLPKGTTVARIKKEKYGDTVSQAFQPGPINNPTIVEVVMNDVSTVSGRVTKEDGSAVADRRLLSQNMTIMQRLGGSGGGYSLDEAKTDESGNYSITDLGEGVYKISVQTPDDESHSWSEVANKTIELKSGETREGVDFVIGDDIERNEKVEGIVVDSEGKPIEFANVNISVQSDDGKFGPGSHASANTSETGEFSVKGLIKGKTFYLNATAKGFANFSKSYDMDGAYLTVTLQSSGSIQGLVVDAETKKPISGAQVTIRQGRNSYDTKFAFTGDDGFFLTENVNPDRYQIFAEAKEYARSETKDTNVQSGKATENIVIELESGMTFTGVLLDENRQPIAGAGIDFISKIRDRMRNPGFNTSQEPVRLADPVLSAADGTFKIDSVSSRGAELIIVHERYADRTYIVDPASIGPEPVPIIMTAGGVLEGSVFDRSGKPLPNAAIGTTSYPDNLFTYQTSTNEKGEYRFLHLPPATYLVTKKGDTTTVSMGSYAIGQEYKQTTIKEGQTSHVDFGVGEGGHVYGTVYDKSEPAAGAGVVIEGSNNISGPSLRLVTVTDETGHYDFKAVPEGEYNIAFSTDSNRSYISAYQSDGLQKLIVTKEQSEYQIDLSARAYEIVGTVRDAETGEAIVGASIEPMYDMTEIPGPRNYLSPEKSNSEGVFKLNAKQTGNYHIIVVKEGFSSEEISITVNPESITPIAVDVRLSKANTAIEANVLYKNQPYDDDAMQFILVRGKMIQQLKPDTKRESPGVYILNGLSEGIVRLMGASPKNRMLFACSPDIQIRKGQTTAALLNLVDVVPCQITLKTPDGETLQGPYSYEVPDAPELANYPTPPIMPNNTVMLISLAGHHLVRLHVPGYQSVEFFPDEMASAGGQEVQMKTFTLEIKK